MENELIYNELQEIKKLTLLSAKQVLDIEGAMLVTGLSKARIYQLACKKEIPHYKQGRLFFKKKELEDWLTSNRVATNTELRSKAIKHCL